MSVVCPTVTASNLNEYREQMARIVPFADRLHLDFADGDFAPTQTLSLAHAYWPEGKIIDLHLMFRNPLDHLETVMALKPDLVIIHAEAEGNLVSMVLQLRAVGVKTGLAILPQTQPEDHEELMREVDHALIFGGKLGYQGGQADLTNLTKIKKIRAINPNIEIAWDGGVNAENVAEIASAGVDVLNAGGAIHKAEDSAAVYADLVTRVEALQ